MLSSERANSQAAVKSEPTELESKQAGKADTHTHSDREREREGGGGGKESREGPEVSDQRPVALWPASPRKVCTAGRAGCSGCYVSAA